MKRRETPLQARKAIQSSVFDQDTSTLHQTLTVKPSFLSKNDSALGTVISGPTNLDRYLKGGSISVKKPRQLKNSIHYENSLESNLNLS